ncbi:hypothetical protein F4825DRAFT_191155 [Nemania diffusa]|nr:hypothetical protein F4825DRAFT_191155 [Nemania diffusa]
MEVKSMLTDPFSVVHCDGALERFKRFGLHSRVERVIVRRDRARSSSARDTRILQGPCIGLTKLGLEWSYRQNLACQEWLEVDIKGQGLLNLPAKQMVYRIIRRSGRCCVHPVRNAGTIVVFDHLGSTIEPAQIQAINTYFQHISKSGEQSPADQVTNEIAERLCEQKPLGSATIQPSMEDFKDFWDRWQGNKETQGQAGGHPAISIQNECAST